MMGRGKQCLLTMVERKSGYVLIGKLQARTSAEATRSALELLNQQTGRVKTITADNGTEFHGYEEIEAKSGVRFYFATPHHSWERGTNENTNGLVRQYLPKGTDLTAYSHHEVAAIQSSLNDRPRKRLGYLTPREVLTQNAARHGVAFGG